MHLVLIDVAGGQGFRRAGEIYTIWLQKLKLYEYTIAPSLQFRSLRIWLTDSIATDRRSRIFLNRYITFNSNDMKTPRLKFTLLHSAVYLLALVDRRSNFTLENLENLSSIFKSAFKNYFYLIALFFPFALFHVYLKKYEKSINYLFKCHIKG